MGEVSLGPGSYRFINGAPVRIAKPPTKRPVGEQRKRKADRKRQRAARRRSK